jgi:hypothetical protein
VSQPEPPDFLWTFSLDFGRAALSFPRRMSPEDVADFEAWLAIVLRAARRRAAQDAPGPPPNDELPPP